MTVALSVVVDNVEGGWPRGTGRSRIPRCRCRSWFAVPPARPRTGRVRLVTQYTDTGNLSSGTPCTHQSSPDDDPYGAASKALAWPNYSVYLRTDGLSTSIPQYDKWFSVREVAPIPAS